MPKSKLKLESKRKLESIRIKEIYEKAKDGGGGVSECSTESSSSDADSCWASSDEEELDCYQLSAFLVEISAEYHIYQLEKFVDHNGSALSKALDFQFRWLKIDEHNRIKKVILEIPLDKVPNDIVEVSRNWINQLDEKDIELFVWRTLSKICYDLGRIPLRCESSGGQVGSFFVLQMVLQCKPHVLISVWPKLEETTKLRYKEEDKNRVLAWVISQALQGNRLVAEFMWIEYLYPLLFSGGSAIKESNALNYKVMESFGGFTYLNIDEVDDAFGNGESEFDHIGMGESALPRSIIEHLARSAFPANSKQDRNLVEGYWAMNCRVHDHAPEVAERIADSLIPFAIKASGEDNFDLAKEARRLFFWCLKNNIDSFKQWDDMYLQNLAGSVYILKKLSFKWRKLLLKNPSILSPLMKTMASFVSKNEMALASEHDAARQAALKKALRYSKTILGPAITLDFWNVRNLHNQTAFDSSNSRVPADSTNDSALSLVQVECKRLDNDQLEELEIFVRYAFCEVEFLKWGITYDVEGACKQLIPNLLKAAGEDKKHDLAKEARRRFIRCLEINLNSFIQWDDAYLENLKGSAYILRGLSGNWRRILLKKRWFLEPLMKCMKSFVSKNDKALSSERDAARRATLVKAQKYAKTILGPDISLDWENLDWLVLKEAQKYGALKVAPMCEALKEPQDSEELEAASGNKKRAKKYWRKKKKKKKTGENLDWLDLKDEASKESHEYESEAILWLIVLLVIAICFYFISFY